MPAKPVAFHVKQARCRRGAAARHSQAMRLMSATKQASTSASVASKAVDPANHTHSKIALRRMPVPRSSRSMCPGAGAAKTALDSTGCHSLTPGTPGNTLGQPQRHGVRLAGIAKPQFRRCQAMPRTGPPGSASSMPVALAACAGKSRPQPIPRPWHPHSLRARPAPFFVRQSSARPPMRPGRQGQRRWRRHSRARARRCRGEVLCPAELPQRLEFLQRVAGAQFNVTWEIDDEALG